MYSQKERLSAKNEEKRIILQNPDGTYTHCYKDGEKDSIYQTFPENEKEKDIDTLTVSDLDLRYIVENYQSFEQSNVLESFIKTLKRNLIIFYIILLFDLVLDIVLRVVVWRNKKETIMLMNKIYKKVDFNTLNIIFYCIYFVAILANAAFYVLGFIAIYRKQIELLKPFAIMSLVLGIFVIFVIYINLLFIILFLFRIIIYIFGKFNANLISSIIILPNKMQNRNENTGAESENDNLLNDH